MSKVGIIANPSAGKDIRRLVAAGRVISNQEKANIITRFIKGLAFKGIKDFYFMPDKSGLFRPSVDELKNEINPFFLDTKHYDGAEQTLLAAELINNLECDCVLVLGGDGTNRLVAKKIGKVPIVPISTGTNNAFPIVIDPTVAGLASAYYIQNKHNKDLLIQHPYIKVIIDKEVEEIALVDLAISKQNFIGSKAIWDPEVISQLFLTQSESTSIGLSSLGSKITDIPRDSALRLEFGKPGKEIYAPIAPGLISTIIVKNWELFSYDKKFRIDNLIGTIALDGERELEIYKKNILEISLEKSGPFVIDVIRSVKEENLSRIN